MAARLPSSPIVVQPAQHRCRRRRHRRRVAPAAQPVSVAPLNETLDEDDEKRLMEEVLASSYQQYKRPRMPISYLKGTSMMAHDPGPGVKPSWCHPRRTMKLGVPIWNRPVTERERLAPPGSTHRPGAGVGSSAGVGASRRSAAGGAAVRPSTVGSGRTGSSVRGRGRSGRSVASTTSNWSRRSPGSRGSSRSFDTVRNGTSLNMPSFHRLPKGHPQSILYSALFPHMPISHIQRPGSAELSSVWQHTRQKQRTVPTATLRAGFHPKSKSTLLTFEPTTDDTFRTSAQRSYQRREFDEGLENVSEAEKAGRIGKGMFTTYIRAAIMQNVEYYKVGH